MPYSLTSKGSNRSVNNNPRPVNYYISPVTGRTPVTRLPGTGTLLPAGQSSADRQTQNFINRYSTGLLSTYGVNRTNPVPNSKITTVGGGVEIAVSTNAGSKSTLPVSFADDRRTPDNLPKNPRGKPLPAADPSTYSWNLPPHKWSLPVEAAVVNERHYQTQRLKRKNLPDRYRRGRIWWRASPIVSVVDVTNTPKNLPQGEFNRRYGFQFLWNPESFGTQVQVQLDATPSVQDRFLGAAGFFPATQTISFTLRLDRTNDFACAQGSFDKQITNTIRLGQDRNYRNRVATNVLSAPDVEPFKQYYTPEGWFGLGIQLGGRKITMEDKLIDLFQRGTIADLEYLYKAINGPGPGGGDDEWINGRGIKTSDIGYLMPTLLHVDVGPLSYDGYVTGIQVNHVAFTPSMIPIRTDVTISLNVLATSGLTQAAV